MNTCKTCKWWMIGRNKDVHQGDCDCPKFLYERDGDAPDDGLQYWDFESYDAGFSTGPDFGCIHWERLTPSPDLG